MHLGDQPWWLLLFFGIGILATITAIVSLFFALGDRPERMWTERIGAVDSDDFLRPIAALLSEPLRDGGTIELLNNGDEWLDRLFEDFAAAQRSINFSVYIWEPGKMSDRMFEVLIARARAGVEVRILLDGLGCMKCPEDCLQQLCEAGGLVDRFRPASIGKLLRFNQRNHRRAIVIDGMVGYTGGMAVGDKWLGNARNEDEWRDTMVRLTGCPVESLQSAFAELWAYVTGEVLTGESFFPKYEPDDSTLRTIGVCSSPAPEEHPLGLFFFLTFLAATKRLWITTPYFVPDGHTLKVIERQAREGVDVRMILPNEKIDAKAIRRASQHYYERLMRAGVRIFEYQPAMIHTKHVVVDSAFTVVGSANLDIRSKELNQENVIGVLDPEFAAAAEAAFLLDLESSEEFKLEEWRRRGLYSRMLERGFAFFNEQF